MRKRFLSMIMGLTLVISSLSACGSTDTQKDTSAASSSRETKSEASTAQQSETAEAAGEIAVDAFAGTELTIAIAKNDADLSDMDFSEKPAAKMAEEATGIKINWTVVDSATKSEKVSTMLASDMPDMMIGLIESDTIAKNMDLFYDLSEEGLLETYAPDVCADYQTIDGAFEALTWADGSIRSLMSNTAINYNAQARGIMYINRTWLDQLGLDMPATAEELYDVMCALLDNDMNGNGDTTDEIPYAFCQNHYASQITDFAGFFGIAGEGEGILKTAKMVKDGNVVSTFDTDEMRTYLEYMHRMAEDGLMDVEGFSQTYEQYCAKLADGLVGIFSGWTPSTYMDSELAKNYTLLTPFSAIDGVEFVQVGRYEPLAANRTTIVISADTENVEAAVHWWNYLSSSTELKYTCSYGNQGETWDINENGEIYTIKVTEGLPSGWTSTNYNYAYALLGGGNGPLVRNDELAIVNTSEGSRPYYVGQVADYLSREYTPVKMTDPDKLSELSFLETELDAYLQEFVATSVMDGITDASWEAHLGQLETVQYYDWIDWYQSFCDGEF